MTPPLKIRPVLDPVEECAECDGLGSVQCEDCKGKGGGECECGECGHQHERECHACDGEGRYACDVCHGWACMVAAREWEHDEVLPLIPSEVLRGILRLAPRLDAAGLPRYGVRVEGHKARPVITVEIRRDDAEAKSILRGIGGWHIEKRTANPSRHAYRQWKYLGPAVRLDVRIARGVR